MIELHLELELEVTEVALGAKIRVRAVVRRRPDDHTVFDFERGETSELPPAREVRAVKEGYPFRSFAWPHCVHGERFDPFSDDASTLPVNNRAGDRRHSSRPGIQHSQQQL